jgi:hypothetical protein
VGQHLSFEIPDPACELPSSWLHGSRTLAASRVRVPCVGESTAINLSHCGISDDDLAEVVNLLQSVKNAATRARRAAQRTGKHPPVATPARPSCIV